MERLGQVLDIIQNSMKLNTFLNLWKKLPMKNKTYYIVFPCNSLAMLANRTAKEHSISVRLTTVPRTVSHKCNLGLKVQAENVNQLKKILEGIDCNFVLFG